MRTIPTTDLRVAHLTRAERQTIEYRARRRQHMRDQAEIEARHRERHARAVSRWRDEQAACFLRGEPETAPPPPKYDPPPFLPFFGY